MLTKQPLENKKTKGKVLFMAILAVGPVSVRKHKWEQDKKSANIVVSKTKVEHLGVVILYQLFFQYVIRLWWIDTRSNIHVCYDVSLFSSYLDWQD